MTQTIEKTDERRELISFRIGAQEFCVDIMAVREIRGWTAATPLPHAPDFMRGVINLRGAVLPVVDLGCRFGLGAAEATARHVVIVVQIGERTVGLLVDAVCDILTVTRDSVQPTPEITSEQVRSFIPGILAIEGRMLSLVSLDRVLPQDMAEAA